MNEALKIVRVVGAAIIQDGRCLVAQRSAKMSLPLKWEFPGGKVEPGEEPAAALAREIREELGVEIAVGQHLGRGTSRAGDRRIVLDVFIAVLTEPESSITLTEHAQWTWLSADEIETLDWAAADVPVLPALLEHLQANS